MIRTDDDSHHNKICNNLLFGTISTSGICIKGLNTASHNILFNASMLTGGAGNTVDPHSTLSHNIFFHTEKIEKGFHIGLKKVREGLDYNVYYNTDDPSTASLEKFLKTNSSQLADRNSISDNPLFKDIEQGDLSFRTGSPAGALGIDPISASNLSKVGTSQDPFLKRYLGKLPLKSLHKRSNGGKAHTANELDL